LNATELSTTLPPPPIVSGKLTPEDLFDESNEKEILVQVYNRDTGERIWDISSPIYIQGRHWGAFRIGYTM